MFKLDFVQPRQMLMTCKQEQKACMYNTNKTVYWTSVGSISLPGNSETQLDPVIRVSALQCHVSYTSAAYEPLMYYSSIQKEVGREWCYRTPPTPARDGDAASRSPSFAHCLPPHRSTWEGESPPQQEPDYLPMSPSVARVMADEQLYTVMASINTTWWAATYMERVVRVMCHRVTQSSWHTDIL
jgi:hypothetical protein